MEVLSKFRQHMKKSKVKIEQNKTDIAYMQIQEETMQKRIFDVNLQRGIFKKQLEVNVSLFKKKNNSLILLEDEKEGQENRLEGIQ